MNTILSGRNQNKTRFFPCWSTWALLLVMLFFGSVQQALAQSSSDLDAPTVETDKRDYFPGEYVTITGSGWQPGETVTLHFDEMPKPESCLKSHDLTAVANADGNIFNSQFLVKENHRGVYFTLTATGVSSNLTAENWFTDATITSTASGGVWNVATTWTGGVVPGPSDAVVILAGANVIVGTTASCTSLLIQNSPSNNVSTTLSINASQTLMIGLGTGLVTIGSGSSMGNGNTNTTALIVNGNLVSGTITQSPATRTMGSGGSGNTILRIKDGAVVTGNGDVSGTNTTGGANGTSGTASVIFEGNGILNLTGSFTTSNFTSSTGSVVNYNANGNQSVRSGSYAKLQINGTGEKLMSGPVVVNESLTVNGTFANGANNLTGAGDIILNNGGKFRWNNTALPGMTGAKTIDAASTFEYYRNSNQNIGGYSYGNLILTSSSAATKTLQGNASVAGEFKITNLGILATTSAYSLTILHTGSVNLTGSNNTYVDGKFAHVYTSTGITKEFPVGKSGNYRPLRLTYTSLSGTSTVTAEQIEGSFALIPATVPSGYTLFASRYWAVSQTGGSSLNYEISLNGTGFSSGTSDPFILKDNGGTTSSMATLSGNYYSANFTDFSNFAMASACLEPTISSHPLSATKCIGGSVTFNVTASGPGSITYQWYKEAGVTDIALNHGDDGGDIQVTNSGATLTRNNLIAADAGDYYVIITRTCGSAKTSSAATLTVRPEFTTGTISSTGETICYGGNPGVIGSTTAASGGDNNISYQWQADGVDIVGANSASYDPGALTATTVFTRLAKDATCNTTFSASSGSWTVTVRPEFTTGTISSTGETICYGGNPGVIGSTTAASGGDNNISYQWQADGVDIVGANSASYDPGALTATTVFTRLAKDATCNTTFSASSGSWTVTVRPEFTTGTISSTGETICYGGNPGVIGSATAASGGDNNISYQWQADGVDIVGANSASYDPGALTATTVFTRLAKDATCNTTFSASSGSWTVTVRPEFTTGTISSTGETICYGGNPGVIGSATAASGGDNNISYQWQADGVDIVGANSASYDPGALTATTVFTRLAKDATCNTTFSASSGSWTVTVRPEFTTGTISSTGETICYGGNPGVIGSATAASGGDNNISYQWQADGVDIVGANSASYDPGALTATTVFTRLAKDATCNTTFTASSGSWTVTVNNKPSLTSISAPAVVCSGNNLTLSVPTIMANGSVVTSQGWQIESAVNSGTFVSFISPYAVSYTDNGKKIRYTATNGCGETLSNEVVITVKQLSVAPTTAVSSANNFCSYEGGTLDLTASGGTMGTGAVVKWYTSSCGGTWIGTGNPLIINKPTVTTTYYARYEGDCNITTCRSVTVTVKALATVTNHLVNNVSDKKTASIVYGCSTPELKVTATGSGILTYRWFSNNSNSNVGGTQIPLAIASSYNIPAATGVGTHYFYAEVSLNGSCPVKSDVFTLTVTQQPADADNEGNAYYTGSSFVWTPTATSTTATVTLAAFLKNKSNEECGDIATARVTFQVKPSSSASWTNIPSATNLPVSYVDPNNPAKGGTAAAIVQLSIGSNSSSEIYDVRVIIGGNYQNSAINSQNSVNVTSISQVIVGKLVPGGAIGGGARLLNTNSSGYVKGSLLHRAEASFGVEYSLKGKTVSSPKGKVNIRVYSYYDRTGTLTPGNLHTYVIKSNAIASLAITSPTATFNSKANIAEEIAGVLDPIEGNCTMIVDLGDYCSTGLSNVLDKVGVTIHRNSGGIWYSNNWVNTKTVITNIFVGDVVVTGTTTQNQTTTVQSRSHIDDVAEETVVQGINVYVFPNPAISHFNLRLTSSNTTEAITLRVYNQLGQVIDVKRNLFSGQVIQVGAAYKQGTYFAEVVQGTQKQNLQLVKTN